MQLQILFLGALLAAVHTYGSQQIQMPEAGALVENEDMVEQLDRLRHNVSQLWSEFSELKTALTQTLNHLRVHQAELEETVHTLEHKHDGSGGAHGSYIDDHHQHHSGEHHGGDSHSHDGDSHSHGGDSHSHGGDSHSHGGDSHSHGGDSRSHSGDSHSHGGDSHSHGEDSHSHGGDSHSHGDDDHHHHSGEHHSHSGEQHSHGGNDHSHGGESHSHGDEQHSHGDDHASWSHSHSHTNSEHSEASHTVHGGNDHHHHHGDSHEKGDDLQQSQQNAGPLVEPLIAPTSTQQHYHHHQQQPHLGVSSMQLINDSNFNHHHHHHHHHNHSHPKSERNNTVVLPKYSEYNLYDFAVCNVLPNRAIPQSMQQDVMGRINLWQKKSGGPLNIHVRLQGFDMGDHSHHDTQQSLQREEDNETPVTIGHKHGFHIHSVGDVSNGCQSTGPHYNPKGVNHGGPNALVRHVGDLGNIECDDHGNVNIVFTDEIASLNGPYSAIGKSMVIHTSKDDYGVGGDEESLRTGNAGTRIACCVIQRVEKLPIRTYKYIKTATTYQNR